MKKSVFLKTATATAVLGTLMLPVTSFAATHGTSYTHPGVTIRNLPRKPLPSKASLSLKAGVHNLGWSASNWSGYAVTGQTYNDITGNWTVPTVQSSHRSTYSSSWIGIDGFNDSDLIQTGTEQDYVNGHAQYDAWWEILPAAETVIPSMVISPGDHMSAHIHNNGNGTWTITLQDLTQNESYTTTQSYSGPASSAEWIQEAPEVNGSIATLANYGETTFDPGTVNGGDPGFTSSDGGDMIQHNSVVSMPSNPDSDTDGFNVAYGSTQPTPPLS